MKKIIAMIVLAVSFQLLASGYAAEENKDLVRLTKQIMDAKSNDQLYAPMEELKAAYCNEHKYAEFMDLLGSLAKKKKSLVPFTDYYSALCRYEQLKYLEEKQEWNEYFSQGSSYRQELAESAKKAVQGIDPKEPLSVYARLLLYKFHKQEQDDLQEAALAELMKASLEYAKSAADIEPIKNVAGELSKYQERAKSRELYKIYVDRVITAQTKDEKLSETAASLYKEGNLELSELIYDAYIERIIKSSPKEKVIPVLIDLARLFAYKDEGLKDPPYAEKIFKKIEELGTKSAFNEELMYLRAFNLEKIKEYAPAKDAYLDLTKQFPGSGQNDEAEYKAGIIYVYALRDIKEGRAYFEKLAKKEILTPQVISSLYQLGLLAQWENNTAGAKEYYAKLLDKSGASFQDTVTLTKERLKEIEEAKPIEYNLKAFLDASLKEGSVAIDNPRSNLASTVYRLKKNQDTKIASATTTPESGCMQQEVQYLWSGHLGKANPSLQETSFDTAYPDAGTKEINVVVISSSGVIDRGIDMVDVYSNLP